MDITQPVLNAAVARALFAIDDEVWNELDANWARNEADEDWLASPTTFSSVTPMEDPDGVHRIALEIEINDIAIECHVEVTLLSVICRPT